jgi:cellulose/xylan binding protein with CBM9 domain
MPRRSASIPRWFFTALLGAGAAIGCEAIAGYNDVEPWPVNAGSGASGGAGPGGAGSGGVSGAGPGGTGAGSNGSGGAGGSSDARNDGSSGGAASGGTAGDAAIEDARRDADAGPCRIKVGNDACETVPRFKALAQIVDGIGDEFCDIPAMEFDVNECPTLLPAEPPDLPEHVFLRIAWSPDAFHLHVKVVDPNVVVNPQSGSLWNGDAVEIYIAGASGDGLTGQYNGTNDGGAIQIVLGPPGSGHGVRGQAFFNYSGQHTSTSINPSTYAGRLVPDGYELELRFPWVAFADPAVPGARIAFDIAIGAQQNPDAGGRQLQCIISNVFVDGKSACGYQPGTPAQPWCDDRTWCQPRLLP